MRSVRTLLALAAAGLGATLAQAQPLPPAPAASAASAPVAAPSPPMGIVGEWQGPFQDTRIVKLLDAEDGVACYLYVPTNVPSSTVCSGQNGCAIHYPGGIGTLSCVKVREGAKTAVKAPAKAAPKR